MVRRDAATGVFQVRFFSNRRPILVLSLIASLLSSCSLDPNVRKQKYFESGRRYFEKGQYQEAAIEFTNAVKIDPGYADAHFQLAESYLHLQQQSRAYQELTRTVELRPEDSHARIEMANLLIQTRHFQDAQEQVDILLKKRPDDPAVHALASSLLAAQDKIPGAIAEIQRTIALAPGRWEPYLSLAFLQLKSNDLYAGEASFKKVIELDPKAMQPRLVLGNYYQSQKRFDEAEKQFRDALALDPNTLDPRKALAGLYLAEGRKADAEEVLMQAKHDLPNNPDSFLALGNFYFTTGDLDKAVTEYRALYLERPKDLEVKEKYIQLLIQAKRYDEARNLDDEILKTNPKDEDALVYRSEMQISDGDVSNAAQTLQTVVKDFPNNFQAHYAFGVALQKQENLEHAESEWREALRLNPDFLDAQRSIADAAMLQGDMNTLEDAANQMIRLQPGSPDGYALRALANINRKHYVEAEQDVRRAIAAAPQSSFGYVQMGNLRFAQKQYSDATNAYQDALDRNADSIDALRGLVNAYIAEKQVDKAIAVVNLQIGKSPTNSNFYNLLGVVLFHSKRDLSGAEAALEKSAALDKHNYDAVIQLCEVRAAKGEIDQAIATGEQSLKDNARQPNLYFLMGNLYESKSDWKRAEDAYQNVLALNSQNPVASNDLARVMLHTGENLDAALSLAQTALRGLPDSPGVVDTLGWIYYQKGVYPLAISNLQEALKLQERNNLPDNPDIHFHLAMAYEKSEQPALAREQFEQVLKIFPNYRDAAEIKKELIRLKS
jgi:tetratricopeptide (TPR) repeat protein